MRRSPVALSAATDPDPRGLPHHALPEGGPYTGASLNPARTIGPAAVFACNVGISFLYIVSELCGAMLAAGLAIFLYGRAPVGRAAGVRTGT